jgi:lysophospholipase L1-like esterase
MKNLIVYSALAVFFIVYTALLLGFNTKRREVVVAKNVAFKSILARSAKSKRAYFYPFIHKDKNIILRKSNEALRNFYLSMDSMTNGFTKKVNIVHIGDSHIQADLFSGKLRENFHKDSSVGNGGRGFVFPYSAIRTNNPYNLKVTYTGYWTGCRNIERDKSCDWGLAGMTATTYDPNATFSIDPNTQAPLGVNYPVTRVKVFYDTHNPASYQVSLLNENVVMSRHIDEKGFVEFRLQKPVDKIIIGFEKTNSRQTSFTLQGISIENDATGVQYHSVGVNGAEVTSYLRTPLFENNLAVLNPDLVIVSLGTNDAYMMQFDEKAFKRNYGMLIQRIKRAAPHASILLTTPGDCFRRRRYPNFNNAKAVKQIMDLAEETESAVWNFYEVMGGLKSMQKWQSNGLAAADRVHLTRKGYTLQGNLLYDALMNDYYTSSGQLSKLRDTRF